MKFSKSIYVTVLTLFLSFNAFSQNSEQFTTTRNLTFESSSKTQAINVKIPENTGGLYIEITCGVRKGNVTIEIYDPNGTKKGEFSVEALETNELEKDDSLINFMKNGAIGEINKGIENPTFGVWKIKFIPENATGQVEMKSTLQS